LRITVPVKVSQCSAINGSMRWRTRKAYVYSNGRGKNYQIRFDRKPPRLREIPRASDQTTPGFALANGTLYGQYRFPSEDIPQRLDAYVGWVFDTNTWKWHSYPGLIVYGASPDSKYVVYGWYTEGTMRMARVSGEE